MERTHDLPNLIADIREDHREIERLLDELQRVIDNNEGEAACMPVLCRIAQYFIRHIQNEERLMNLTNNTLSAGHNADHGRIFDSISRELDICSKYAAEEWASAKQSIHEMWSLHSAEYNHHLYRSPPHHPPIVCSDC